MNYIESVKKFSAESKAIVLEEIEFLKNDIQVFDEKTLVSEHAYPYVHNLGHLDILGRILEKIESGTSEEALKTFIHNEKVKAETYVADCDKKNCDDIFDYHYFIADGIACELNEDYFLKAREIEENHQ